MNWLEVSLIVDGELAEAVAEVLARFAPGGVVVESTQVEQYREGGGRAVGPLRVAAYLEVDSQLEETRHKIEEAIWYLGRIRPLPEPAFKPITEVNWVEAWKQHYHPIAIGERLIIVPAWLTPPVNGMVRIPIFIDPGMAFGTGTHPTTQLCLELLETQFLKENEFMGCDLLDIGSGSGILSIAAVKLGAERAFGVDVESDALPSALKNAETNGVSAQVNFAIGSIDDVKKGVFPIQKAPLVVANMIAPILSKLLDGGMADLVAPGGTLLLSGILEEQMPAMQEKLAAHGLHILERRQIEDWVALSVAR